MKKRSGLLLFLAAALALAGAGGCADTGADEKALASQPLAVKALAMTETTREITRRYSGFLHPWEASGPGFMVAGRVTSLKVREGDHVRKGQLLATINPDDYALVKDLADIQAGTIEPNLRRVKALVEKNVLPQSQLDELQGRYQAAVTQREQAGRQVEYTRLNSPISGIVMETRTAEGQVIGAGSPVAVILTMDRMKFKVGVPQRDIGYFSQGQKLPVTVPGLEGQREGVVEHIDYVGDAKTRTYNVSLAMSNADSRLRASMFGHLTLVAERHTGFFVPLHAVLHDPVKRTPLLMVVDDSGARAMARPVTLGPLVGEEIMIADGLKPGDRVIIKGHEFLTSGQAVELQ